MKSRTRDAEKHDTGTPRSADVDQTKDGRQKALADGCKPLSHARKCTNGRDEPMTPMVPLTHCIWNVCQASPIV